MKLELKFLTIALISIVLAIPVAVALQHRSHQLKIERSQNNTLQLRIKSDQKILHDKQLQQERLKKQNDELKKKLQAKREAQAKLAQARSAPVAFSGGSGSCEKYRGIIAQYDWNTTTALAVCQAESGGNPKSANWGDHHPTCNGSYGLFQIGCDSTGGLSINSLFNPATNIAHAYALYKSRGWQPWGATTCAYKVSCV